LKLPDLTIRESLTTLRRELKSAEAKNFFALIPYLIYTSEGL